MYPLSGIQFARNWLRDVDFDFSPQRNCDGKKHIVHCGWECELSHAQNTILSVHAGVANEPNPLVKLINENERREWSER